jgi:predicted transcriptional regulator
MKKKKTTKLKSYLKTKLKDDEFKVAYEEVKIHLKIANLLEELRHKAGLTQADLAKKTGVSQPMIARLERGDQDRVPTLHTINKIFRSLGYEVDLVVKRVA